MRNDQKKIVYHRSVDIYALGLTFLAMIQGNKPLVPQLETAKDQSELYNSIGSTIATRIKHGIKPVKILAFESSSGLADKFKKLLSIGSSSSDSSSSAAAGSTSSASVWDDEKKTQI